MRDLTKYPVLAAEAEEILYAVAKTLTDKPNRPTPDMTPLILKMTADYITENAESFEDFARDDI